MKAGPMKYSLVLFEPIYDKNSFGEEVIEYIERNTIHAERTNLRGSYGVEDSERFPDYRAEFNIRAQHKVKENWRVKQLGGELYTVVNILPYINYGFKTLVCERVNE